MFHYYKITNKVQLHKQIVMVLQIIIVVYWLDKQILIGLFKQLSVLHGEIMDIYILLMEQIAELKRMHF